jgi:hypothetical protein
MRTQRFCHGWATLVDASLSARTAMVWASYIELQQAAKGGQGVGNCIVHIDIDSLGGRCLALVGADGSGSSRFLPTPGSVDDVML